MNQGQFQVWMGVFQHAMATYVTEGKGESPEDRADMAVKEADAAAEQVGRKIQQIQMAEQAGGSIIVPNMVPPGDLKKGQPR